MKRAPRQPGARRRSVSSAITIVVVVATAIIGLAAFVAPSGSGPVGEPVTLSFRPNARVVASIFAGTAGHSAPLQTNPPETSATAPQVVTTSTKAPEKEIELTAEPVPESTPAAVTTTSIAHVEHTSTTTKPPVTTTHAPSPTTTHPPSTTTTTHPPTTTSAPPTTTAPISTTLPPEGKIERWRPLVEQYFAADRVDEALAVIKCESRDDPNAKNSSSGAAGLFQFIPSTWTWVSPAAGWPDASPFDAEANIASAGWLVQSSLNAGQPAWKHWSCQP